MRMFRLAPGVLAPAVFAAAALAQDAAPEKAPKTADRPPAGASSAEQLRLVLQDAYKALMALEKKPDDRDGVPEIGNFEWINVEEPKAETLLAIGSAHARLGDLDSARKAWQDALDMASAIHSYDGNETKAKLIATIAEAQAEAGDREDALATLQQAAQASRLMRSAPGRLRLLSRLGADSGAARVASLRAIASVQIKAGDTRAARKTFAQAVEAAGAIKNAIYRTHALVQVAGAEDPTGGKEAWARTVDFALAVSDEFERARSVELVVRGLTALGRADEALRIAKERLKDDLNTFALATIAEELLASEKPAPAAVVQSLRESAEGAKYDQRSKRIKVFTQIAILLARVGDSDGAYKALESVNPKKAVQRTNAIVEKVRVMKELAQYQLAAGKKAEAKDLVQTALESIAPFQGVDGEVWYPIQDLVELLAKAGDPADAVGMALNMHSSHWRIEALLAIARVQAESGDRAAAQKTIDEAVSAVRGIPNEMLWSGVSYEVRRLSRRRGAASERLDMDLMFSTNQSIKYNALKDIAIARANAGDVARGLEAAKSIPKGENRFADNEGQEALAEIAKVQAKTGDIDGALKTAELLQDDREFGQGKKGEVLSEIAQAQVKAGRAREVLDSAGKTKSPKAKLGIWRTLASAIAPKQQAEKGGDTGVQP